MRSESYLDGWVAHRFGLDLEDNPHHPDRQAASRRHWMTGWSDRDQCSREDLEEADARIFSEM